MCKKSEGPSARYLTRDLKLFYPRHLYSLTTQTINRNGRLQHDPLLLRQG